MRRDLTLGVDSGTQSVKVVACDAAGVVVDSAEASHTAACVQCPESWWSALIDACRRLQPSTRDAVAAMSVDAQQHGCVPLGAAPHHPVLGEARLWCDTSSAGEAERLNGLADFAAETGTRLVASITITKLAALGPEVAAVCLPHDWLTLRLTGRLVTDRGDASGTGWWSPSEGVRRDLLQHTGREALQLPTVLGPDEAAGTLLPAAAAALGLPAGIAVGAGTGDNMAAALGVGAEVGDLVVSLGTSGTVFSVAETWIRDATGTIAGFADATGRYLPLACTLNCTAPVDLLARWLGTTPSAALDLADLDTELLFLPYLAGERTPDLPRAAGVISGLRTDTHPADLVGAAVVGAAHGLQLGADALAAAGVPAARQCLLLGGGARHATWRQAVADALQVDVVCPDGEHHAARGSAVQARAVLERATTRDVAASWRPHAQDGVRPRPQAHRSHAHETLTRAMAEVWS